MSETDESSGQSSEPQVEAEEDPLTRLEKIIRFAGGDLIYYVVERTRLTSLPPMLQSFSTRANADLLKTLGIGLKNFKGDVFAYSSEKNFHHGAIHIKKLPGFEHLRLAPIGCSPLTFFLTAAKNKASSIHVDYGLPGGFSLEGDQIAHLDKLADVIAVARRLKVYVLEDIEGYALNMDWEGGNYALGFLVREDGLPTLAGLQGEMPGSRLGANKLRDFVGNVLESDFDGIVFNPASSSQAVFGRQELQLLSVATTVLGPVNQTPKFLEKIIGLFSGG